MANVVNEKAESEKNATELQQQLHAQIMQLTNDSQCLSNKLAVSENNYSNLKCEFEETQNSLENEVD